ncbi:MAG: chondroitinase-B domain-containing protein [Oceanipulchritudo sp.]
MLSKHFSTTIKRLVAVALPLLVVPVFVHGAAFYPQNKDEFRAARDAAQPGDRIVLPAGELDWGQIYIGASGQDGAPITIEAPSIFATTLTGSSYFQVAGSHIVLRGFKFKNTTTQYPVWLTTGSHNRVTQCYFEEAEASSLLRADGTASPDTAAGSHHRIDHNYFTTTTQAALTIVGHESEAYVGQHVIEYNVFRDAPRRRLGAEAIILYSLGKHLGYKTNAIVRFNVFDKWDSDIESEIVSIKGGGNTFYRNVFAWCTGYFSLRRENENLVDSNLFHNNSEGIWVYGNDHVIVNNILENIGRRGLNLRNGWESGGIEGRAAMNCVIANNTFLNVGKETFSFETSSGTFTGSPAGNWIANNILHASGATGILINDEIGFFSVGNGNTVDTNLVYTSNGSYGPTGTNPIQAQAQLSGSGYQLYLASGSPAIDAGLPEDRVSLDFFGNDRISPLDVGHHEYSAAPQPQIASAMPPIPPDRSTFASLPLEAAFTVFPLEVKAGEPMNLDASISKGGIVSYTWDLGDGHIYEGPESFYPYDWSTAGQKDITLTVEDGTGATHSTSLAITVLPADPDPQGWLDTGPWLGWVNTTHEPWWWINSMSRYAYVAGESGWIYFNK